MATVANVVVQARRSVSESYCTREQAYTVSVDLDEGDDPRAVLTAWTERLQFLVDMGLGDRDSPKSFARHNRVTAKTGCLCLDPSEVALIQARIGDTLDLRDPETWTERDLFEND